MKRVIRPFHTAKFYNQIVTEMLLACHTHCSPSNNFHSGFTEPTFYMYQNTHQSLSNYLPYLVVGSLQCGTWVSTNYMSPLGKRSCFQQHLVSCVPAWQAIVVGILDGKYSMHVWWPRREKLWQCCCSWGRNCARFYHYLMNKQCIWFRFGFNPPPKMDWVECAFNSHRPKLNCECKVWTWPMCIQ